MSVEVRVTSVLQPITGGAKSVQAEGKTVGEILTDLDRAYPGFLGRVMQEDGKLHRFVNIYLNDEDIRYLGQLDTSVQTGDVVSILPALAGGDA
jgi:molybdopterin synthase sulfur carrier subunit